MTNLVNIIEVIANKVSISTTEEEILFLSKIIEKLNLCKVKTVATYNDMLDGVNSFGDLYFVENENTLYYTFGNERISIIESAPAGYSWGSNQNAELGDGTTIYKRSPVSVISGFTDWIQVSAGDNHGLLLKTNGTAWGWGFNGNGRLGDGTTANKSSAVAVVGGFIDWIQINAGSDHSLGIRANGTLWSWGYNFSGQLGDGTIGITGKSSPVSVLGGYTDWIQVSGGNIHTLALRANGTAWAWGTNTNGILGDGTTVSKLSPVSVIGGFTDWTQLSAGRIHSMGLRSNGTLWAWGTNNLGQLGNNTTVTFSSPVSVVGGFTDWTQVSAGGTHTMGLRSNGTLWAWGRSNYGQLGNNTISSFSSPVSVAGGFADWVDVSAGYNHTIALRSNGTAWSWGQNNRSSGGQLGDGTTTNRSSPVFVVGGFTDWIDISAGEVFSSAIRTTG